MVKDKSLFGVSLSRPLFSPQTLVKKCKILHYPSPTSFTNCVIRREMKNVTIGMGIYKYTNHYVDIVMNILMCNERIGDKIL